MSYKFFLLEKAGPVATIWLNRPEKRNFMNWDYWFELPLIIDEINNDDSIKVFIIAAKGSNFSIGLDLPSFVEDFAWLVENDDINQNQKLHKLILQMQQGTRSLINSPKPSIAAVHRSCLGGALDLISACDIRYASADAIFSLMEIKVGIVADIGSLQLLPHIIGEGATRELALTGRDVKAEEALALKLITKMFDTKEDLYQGALKTATEIANNSSLVEVVEHLCKSNINYTSNIPINPDFNSKIKFNNLSERETQRLKDAQFLQHELDMFFENDREQKEKLQRY